MAISAVGLSSFKPLTVLSYCAAAKKILVTGHSGPDTDLFASCALFGRLIENLNPRAKLTCYLDTPLPQRLKSYADNLPIRGFTTGSLFDPSEDFDLIVSLDTPAFDYLPAAARQIIRRHRDVPIINIDHHYSDDAQAELGHIFYTVPGEISAAQLVFALLRLSRVIELNDLRPRDKWLGEWLYAGMVTDGLRFGENTTAPEKIAQVRDRLAEARQIFGLDETEVMDRLFRHSVIDKFFLTDMFHRSRPVGPGQNRFLPITKLDLDSYRLVIDDIRRLIPDLVDRISEKSGSELLLFLVEAPEETYSWVFKGQDSDLDLKEFTSRHKGHSGQEHAFIRLGQPLEEAGRLIIGELGLHQEELSASWPASAAVATPSPNTDMLPCYDDEDNLMGLVRRKEVHQKGLWHHTVHFLPFDRQGRLGVQKRALGKESSGGRLSQIVGGHMAQGSTPLETLRRETEEETGNMALVEDPVFLGRFDYQDQRSEEGYYNRERVFLYVKVYDGPLAKRGSPEVEWTDWFRASDIVKAMEECPDLLSRSLGWDIRQLFRLAQEDPGRLPLEVRTLLAQLTAP